MNTEKAPLGVRPEYLRKLSNEAVAILEKLEAWPLEILRTKLRENSQFRDEAELERYFLFYKQFMFFKGSKPNRVCGLHSPRVDAIWHQHVLYTEEYSRFCQHVFGHFVHHTPCDVLKLTSNDVFQWNNWMFGEYPKAFVETCPLESADAPIQCG